MPEIKGFDRLGNRISFDEALADDVVKAGGRLATQQELAEARVEADYAKRSTIEKVGGLLAPALPAPVQAALHGTGAVALPPTLEAYRQGASRGMTGGLGAVAEKAIADTVGPEGAGRAYVQRADDVAAASPAASGLGELAGFGAGMVAGGVGGAAGKAATPALSAMTGAGGAIEHGVTRALGGLAARGGLGKAATQAAAMSVRGAVEGGTYAGLDQATSDFLHDTPQSGEKLYGAVGHGALLGGELGAALGIGGAIVGAGGRRVASFFRRAEGGAPAALAEAAATGESAARRGVELPAIDADAGLRQRAPKAEDVLSFDRREVSLRGQGKHGRTPDESPINLADGLRIDPDAGIAPRDARGRMQGRFATEDPLYMSEAKTARRRAGIRPDPNEMAPLEAGGSPIKIPGAAEAPGAAPAERPSGLGAALADPTSTARAMAQDQAWKAVGAGFGLQTTRYAKEAARYFPNGTRDLGEVAIRHGLLDMGEAGASPWASAMAAAKSGTPSDIALRASAASDSVGAQIGAITDASGARVPLAAIDAGIADVRRGYAKIAGNEHVVDAIDRYAESLRSKLTFGADGATSLQALLEQRKGLDEIVYRETKTLDPGRRVQALREVRGNLESVITGALDEASGKVPGAERAEYQRLKKDYHALRILSEAAEDSAARSSKGATLGLGEKFALGSALASGHVGAAPVLAVGGKLLRERGNAAAAAFLSRAAEQGTFAKLVNDYNARISRAAAGALSEPARLPSGGAANAGAARGREISVRPSARGAVVADRAEQRREASAKQQAAEHIVKWIGDHRASPDRLARELEEAAATIGRSAGPKAAESYSASVVKAISFIAAHVPIKERRDPLDPRSVPPLSREESDRLLRATRYAVRPEHIWDDFARGVVTPEGLRAAKELQPESFGEFQIKLQSLVEDRMLAGHRLSGPKRLTVSKLLGYPAGAEMRPRAMARLQANLMKAEGPTPDGPQGGGGPLDMKIQQSGFDAIEARHSTA